LPTTATTKTRLLVIVAKLITLDAAAPTPCRPQKIAITGQAALDTTFNFHDDNAFRKVTAPISAAVAGLRLSRVFNPRKIKCPSSPDWLSRRFLQRKCGKFPVE